MVVIPSLVSVSPLTFSLNTGRFTELLRGSAIEGEREGGGGGGELRHKRGRGSKRVRGREEETDGERE